MIAAVREGKLLTMEGDHDHIVNRGSLCLKRHSGVWCENSADVKSLETAGSPQPPTACGAEIQLTRHRS